MGAPFVGGPTRSIIAQWVEIGSTHVVEPPNGRFQLTLALTVGQKGMKELGHSAINIALIRISSPTSQQPVASKFQ